MNALRKSQYIYRPAGYGSGKMPDLRRGDIVGFHGSPFNLTYVLSNVNTP